MTCRLLGSFVLMLAVAGCANETGIIVSIDGSALSVPGDIDGVRVVVRGVTSGRTADAAAPIDGTWPQSVAVRPGDAGNGEMVVVTVFGTLGTAARVRRVLPAMFVDGRSVPLEVRLEASCLDVVCPNEVDCRSGACVDGPPPDAGTDASMDVPMIRDSGRDVPIMSDGGPDVPVLLDAGPDIPVMPDAGPDVPVMPDGGPDGGPDTGPPPVGTLIISEYIEGSSNNKAIELYNASSATVNLAECTLELRSSCGSGAPIRHDLSGTLAAGQTHVLCNSSIDAAAAPRCDEMPSVRVINHNGDDVYELSCGGMLLDTFGSTMSPCPSNWSGGGASSRDQTLRRRMPIVTGDTNLADAFDPSIEWENFAQNAFDGLGAR